MARKPETPPSQTSEAREARGKRQRLVRLPAELDERYQDAIDRGYTGADIVLAGVEVLGERGPPSEPPRR